MTFFNQLKQLQKKAYAPYSHYKVAAIAIVGDKQYEGVNIENAAYGIGTCAERTAIANAIVAGEKKIDNLHILCDSGKKFGSPCGACRQFMAEFMHDNAKIFLYNNQGDITEYYLKSLLPSAFRKTYLKERKK